MDVDTKSLVEVSDGQTCCSPQKPKHISSIRDNLKSLPLRKIYDRARRAECRTDDNKKEDPQGDSSAMCVNRSCSLNQAHTILSTIDQQDYVSKDQSSGNGNFEARCDDLPRGHSNEGGIDQEMEIEGDGELIGI